VVNFQWDLLFYELPDTSPRGTIKSLLSRFVSEQPNLAQSDRFDRITLFYEFYSFAFSAILAGVIVSFEYLISNLGPVFDCPIDESPLTRAITDHEAIRDFFSQLAPLGQDQPDRESYLLPTSEAIAIESIPGGIIL